MRRRYVSDGDEVKVKSCKGVNKFISKVLDREG